MNRARKLAVGLGAAGILTVGALAAAPALADDDGGEGGSGVPERHSQLMEHGRDGRTTPRDRDCVDPELRDRTRDEMMGGDRDRDLNDGCDLDRERDRDREHDRDCMIVPDPGS